MTEKMIKHQEFFKLNTTQMMQYIQATALPPAALPHRQTQRNAQQSAQASGTPLQAIDSRDISVVIQGPVFSNMTPLAPNGITRQVLKALRQHLPQATLILSTWKGQPIDGLDADIILQLDDPGTTNFYKPNAKAENLYNNGNRLILDSQ